MARRDDHNLGWSDETQTALPSSEEGSQQRAKVEAPFTAQQTLEKSKRHEDDIRNSTSEAEVNRRWYPYIFFTISLNFCLLISIFYVIYEAEYYAQNRSRYLAYAWLIFFLPLIVTTFVIFSPVPQRLREGRTAFIQRDSSLQLRKCVNVFSALASFALAVAYLYSSAIPRYNSPQWSESSEFRNTFPIPTVAFLVVHEALNSNGQTVRYPLNYTTGPSGHVIDAGALDDQGEDLYPPDSLSHYPILDLGGLNLTVIQANSSKLAKQITNPLGTVVEFVIHVNYNSSVSQSIAPSIIMMAFDSRLEVRKMLLCGLVPYKLLDAFATNTFSLSVANTYDRHGLLTPPAGYDPSCEPWYKEQLSRSDSYYSSFDLFLDSSIQAFNVSRSECDVAITPNATCTSSVILVLSNQFVVTRRTVPGITILDIWLNLGAVVGAVQFFGWFLQIAVGG